MRKWIAGLFAATSLGGGALYGADKAVNPYEDKATHYELDIKADIEQGERVEIAKDKAAMTLKGWNDEYAITITPQIPNSTTSFNSQGNRPLLSKKVEYREGDVTAFIEPRSDTEFDIDFTLHSKPNTNVFTYKLDGTENFDFFYQPERTPEEITSGASRPENIDGSYAVYHKTKTNHRIGDTNYATGKAFHIYRPKAIDANGAEIWAELSYSNNVLSVTVPQNFLDVATYPVVVDPAFGSTAAGASQESIGLNTSDTSTTVGSTITPAESGTALSATAFLTTGAGTETADIFFALYEEDATADSHTLRSSAETLDASVTTAGSWFTKSLTAYTITNVPYVLAALADGEDIAAAAENVYLNYDVSGNRNRYSESTTGAGGYATRKAENPWTETETASTRLHSIYITYTCDTPGSTCTDTFTVPGYNTWTAPTGVTSVIAACWGAGGGGGIIAADGGAGGGGGAFASSTLSVTAGTTYGIRVGAGGAADSDAWAQDSSFATTSCPNCVIASGGSGASPTARATNGLGGPTASSTGTTKVAGGPGGDGSTTGDLGGGGGGAGGPHGTGGTGGTALAVGGGGGGANAGGNGGADGSPGTAGPNAGAGGTGSNVAAGTAGSSGTYGGGGGGGGGNASSGNGGTPGGGGAGAELTGGSTGGTGQCTITYTVAAAAQSTPEDDTYFEILEAINWLIHLAYSTQNLASKQVLH